MSLESTKSTAVVLVEPQIPPTSCGPWALINALGNPAGWDSQPWWKQMIAVHGLSIFTFCEAGSSLHPTAQKKQVEVGLCGSSEIFESLPSRLSEHVAEGERLPPMTRIILDATGEKEELLISLGDRFVYLQQDSYNKTVKLAKQGAVWTLVGTFDLIQQPSAWGCPRRGGHRSCLTREINPPLISAFSQFLNLAEATEEIVYNEVVAPKVIETFSGLLPSGVTNIVLGYAGARSPQEIDAEKKRTQALRDTFKVSQLEAPRAEPAAPGKLARAAN